ncbi:hypothetical protein [Streptomyces sp. NPDC005322]|uniref:hypothetical protein n=1 Tax=unclassified Streptomyces TaxID=2593676 RepID=UPI0033A3853B
MASHAGDVKALRREGVHRILTPEECLAVAADAGQGASPVPHPLCGGMPVEEGRRSLELFAERVLPRLKD